MCLELGGEEVETLKRKQKGQGFSSAHKHLSVCLSVMSLICGTEWEEGIGVQVVVLYFLECSGPPLSRRLIYTELPVQFSIEKET